MRVDGTHQQSLSVTADGRFIDVIDQTALPARFVRVELKTLPAVADAIFTMVIRGAPLIGVTAAFGLAFGLRDDASDAGLERAVKALRATRPTAVNLAWALEEVRRAVAPLPASARADAAFEAAKRLHAGDVEICRALGAHALPLLRAAWEKKGQRGRLDVLTHCNAGWLATVDYGTALSGLFQAHDGGLPVHVWVDETRPRNQGFLTAWELRAHGVPHTVIVDNAGGLLMQRGKVDLCIVGTDRTAANGDVCNKVGTYLKALAAHDNQVPFYVAAPKSSIDRTCARGADIEIEERSADEVRKVAGVEVLPAASAVANPGFDVTPARLVTALVTEAGVVPASPEGIARAFAS